MAKLNISGVITKNSVKKFTLKPTADEFTLFILAFGLLKYTACAVSIASGFAFFYYKLKDLISGFMNAEIVSVILAILLLICLELITNTATAKSFKMLFKSRYRAAVGCIVIAVLFFSVSFKISCQGIYLALSDTHKETENINAKYIDDANELRRSNAAKIAAYESDIAALVGPVWNNNNLTTEQLRMRQNYRMAIDSIYKAERRELATIEAAQAAEVAAANASASSSAEDYRLYVAIILILEILANAVLQYYNKKILHDTDKAVEKQEFIDHYVDETRQELGSAIESELQKEKSLYMSVIAARADQARQSDKEAATHRAAAAAKRPAGFNIQPHQDTPKPQPPKQTQTQETDPAQNQRPSAQDKAGGYKIGVCPLCGKAFNLRTTWQKFCCENHRLQYYANRKGYTFKGVSPDYSTYPNIIKGALI